MAARRKRCRTDPKTGERAPRRGWEPGICACGFPQKLKRGLLVFCRVCREGHYT